MLQSCVIRGTMVKNNRIKEIGVVNAMQRGEIVKVKLLING